MQQNAVIFNEGFRVALYRRNLDMLRVSFLLKEEK